MRKYRKKAKMINKKILKIQGQFSLLLCEIANAYTIPTH
jgi:hypothetical protein